MVYTAINWRTDNKIYNFNTGPRFIIILFNLQYKDIIKHNKWFQIVKI